MMCLSQDHLQVQTYQAMTLKSHKPSKSLSVDKDILSGKKYTLIMIEYIFQCSTKLFLGPEIYAGYDKCENFLDKDFLILVLLFRIMIAESFYQYSHTGFELLYFIKKITDVFEVATKTFLTLQKDKKFFDKCRILKQSVQRRLSCWNFSCCLWLERCSNQLQYFVIIG